MTNGDITITEDSKFSISLKRIVAIVVVAIGITGSAFGAYYKFDNRIVEVEEKVAMADTRIGRLEEKIDKLLVGSEILLDKLEENIHLMKKRKRR